MSSKLKWKIKFKSYFWLQSGRRRFHHKKVSMFFVSWPLFHLFKLQEINLKNYAVSCEGSLRTRNLLIMSTAHITSRPEIYRQFTNVNLR